ncbi:MAG: hypothetical protein JKY95_15505 [Planctomycetaceae bacterium]|nr:hypothetical protein [Planctomycetaceae bacterium]
MAAPKKLSAKQAKINLAQAELLAEKAYNSSSPQEQILLVQEALELSQDCVNAYLLLSQLAETSEESLPLLQQAVEAGHRVLKEDFEHSMGVFWLVPETRPYMQARQWLSECLVDLGQVEEAIDHDWKTLQLNPNDNQGIRYALMSKLLQVNRIDDLGRLIGQYSDDYSAEWKYTQALLAFMKEGDTAVSQKLLHQAEEYNKHVPEYLTKVKPFPREHPESISPGEDSEAVSYCGEFLRHWRGISGAIPWLRSTLSISPQKDPVKRPKLPHWSKVKHLFEQIPQDKDIHWEVDLIQLQPSPTGVRAWVFIVVEENSGELVANELWEQRPRDSELLPILLQAIRSPGDREPTRPGRIYMRRKMLLKAWSPKLAQIDIQCKYCDSLLSVMDASGQLQQYLERGEVDILSEHLDLEQIPQSIGEVWQVDVAQLPTWIEIAGQMTRPTACLVFDPGTDLVLSTNIREEVTDEIWWDTIKNTMVQPFAGEARRPGVIEITPHAPFENLRDRLEEIGVRCVVCEELPLTKELFTDLADHLGGPQRIQPLTRSPGISVEQIGQLFTTAAQFYRAAPWNKISGYTIICIETDDLSSGPWYAMIMGQQGMELGIALYEDLELLQMILAEKFSDEEGSRRTSAISLTFGEEWDIAPEDLDAMKEHNWPVADAEAYPSVLRINPGMTIRVPLAWEIELLVASLQSILSFLDEPGLTHTHTTTTATREFTLKLTQLPGQ